MSSNLTIPTVLFGVTKKKFPTPSSEMMAQDKKPFGGLAQSARASALQAEGQGFDSLNLHGNRPF